MSTKDKTLNVGWVEILLVLSIIALVLQIWPALFWVPLSYLDVRAWTWKSYATLSAIWICVMVYLRSREQG